MAEPESQIGPSVLYPRSSGRRPSSASNSPEFEFWMVRNPTLPQTNLLSADELFSHGVLLPLDLLHRSSEDPPDPCQEIFAGEEPSDSNHLEPQNGSNAEVSCVLAGLSAPTVASSKRWKGVFKKSDSSKEREKEKKRLEKKNGNGGGNSSNGFRAAELNINIWPFSRSRSAGNGGIRPRMSSSGIREVSSAPCSRSNSTGDSKSRKWPSSPSRGGVHLGRNSPVWQVRRGGFGGSTGRSMGVAVMKNADKGVKRDGNEAHPKQTTAAVAGGGGGPKDKVLHMNVPMCVGYGQHLSCRSDENSANGVATAAASGGFGSESNAGVRGSNLFNVRSLFTKKIH